MEVNGSIERYKKIKIEGQRMNERYGYRAK